MIPFLREYPTQYSLHLLANTCICVSIQLYAHYDHRHCEPSTKHTITPSLYTVTPTHTRSLYPHSVSQPCYIHRHAYSLYPPTASPLQLDQSDSQPFLTLQYSNSQSPFTLSDVQPSCVMLHRPTTRTYIITTRSKTRAYSVGLTHGQNSVPLYNLPLHCHLFMYILIHILVVRCSLHFSSESYSAFDRVYETTEYFSFLRRYSLNTSLKLAYRGMRAWMLLR